MSNRAWVTLATNDSYGLGALVLAHSLRRVGSSYPAVVLITPAVTDAMRDRLRAVFAEVITVDVLDSQDAAHLALLQRPELGITFTKLHCWNLTQYDRCVFLDADILVVQNSDELFEREELSAAPDVGWPDCFNSGVFVFQPSADTFSRLITFAQERGSFDGGDQGLLNSFFPGWAADSNKRLPFLYNVTSAAFYSYLPALKHYGQNLKIIHFIGPAKPWLQHYNFESRSVDAPEHLRGFLQLWWDLFTSQVHTQLDESMENLEEPPEGRVHYETDRGLPQDYVEHRLDTFAYQPTLDSTSEFPWHHPDKQTTEHESRNESINKNEFYDPWNSYSGNIPSRTDESKATGQNAVWDNISPYVPQDQHSTQACNIPQHYTTHTDDQNWYDTQNNLHLNHHVGQEQLSDHGDIGDHTSFDTHIFHQDTYNREPQNNYCHNHKTDTRSFISPAHEIQQNKVKQVYCVHMDYEKPLLQHTIGTYYSMNGDALNENGFYDDIRPRHPYDGFYLRHKVTVDSRGRKICTHEMRLRSPSPPESLAEYEDAMDQLQNGYRSEEEDDTGVAGNLARVQPGVDSQREAIDELTRRQGWESGNIDYMGADSFDNILAKISQTLNQGPSSPPNQPSPPKEFSAVSREQAKDATEELADKVAAASLSETADVPVPATEAANAAGKTSDSSSPVTAPQAGSEASIPEAETKTETSTAPNETVAAANISQPPAPTTEVPKQETTLGLVEPETAVAESDATPTSSHDLHETKPLEPTSSENKEVHEPDHTHENDVSKTDSISEIPVDVHVAEPVSETPIEPFKAETTQATPAKSLESAPEALSIDASKEKAEPSLSDVHESKPTEILGDSAKAESVSTPSDVHESETTELLSDSSKAEGEVSAIAPESEPVSETVSVPSNVHESKPTEVLSDSLKVESEVPVTVPEPKPATETVSVTSSDVHELKATEVLSDQSKLESEVSATILESKPASETVPTPSVVHDSKPATEVLTNAPVIEAEPAPVAPESTPVPTETSPALDVQEATIPVADSQKSQASIPMDTPKPESESAPSEPKQDKTPDKTDAPVSDSPPLANTPSQEEIPSVTAAKLAERRKPAGKLQLSPPSAADPAPTPDSELEDAATLAQSIIASELRPPTVPAVPLASPQLPTAPDVRTPDVSIPPPGAVSLSQIGVKSKAKPTTASQIESSVSDKPATEAPKKKVVKKAAKKDAASAGEAPVPPPRKKEKKPKDK